MLEVRKLTISSGGTPLVDQVNFSIDAGEVLVLVGESGSGKSLTAQSIMQLLDPRLSQTGDVLFQGQELTRLTEGRMKSIRGREISMVFQDPLQSLNPLYTIGKQFVEVYQLHTQLGKEAVYQQIGRWLRELGLEEVDRILGLYPYELSGGMGQRVMIAMAMCLQPRLLIADEPTSALDPELRDTVVQLLKDLNQKYQTAMLFISHDMDTVKGFAQRTLIMRQGRLIEEGLTEEIFHRPQTDYGRLLVEPLPALEKKPINPEQVLLSCQKLSSGYHYRQSFFSRGYIPILEDLSLDLPYHSVTGLIGPSGSGKSSLAKNLTGLVRPRSGTILFKGRPIYDSAQDLWAYADPGQRRQLNQAIQIIFQNPGRSLDPKMSIYKLLNKTLIKQGVQSKADRLAQMKAWLHHLRLPPETLDKYPRQLSGGMAQRVAIIRALIQAPDLLICDEITSALDTASKRLVLDLLMDLKEDLGLTLLFISHDHDLVQGLSHQVYDMRVGRVESCY